VFLAVGQEIDPPSLTPFPIHLPKLRGMHTHRLTKPFLGDWVVGQICGFPMRVPEPLNQPHHSTSDLFNSQQPTQCRTIQTRRVYYSLNLQQFNPIKIRESFAKGDVNTTDKT
jgi:hypothetical protein